MVYIMGVNDVHTKKKILFTEVVTMLSADRIMGVKEAAELLGVSSQAFANLRNRYKEDFPVPCVELTATPIFMPSRVFARIFSRWQVSRV